MAQDTCHEMKGNREKNEEQGEKISLFFFLSGVLRERGKWIALRSLDCSENINCKEMGFELLDGNP